MMETNTEPLKTIRDFIRYCTTRLYSSEATFNHGYQNPEEEAAFLVLRTLRIPLEYEDKFLDAALTNNERETVLNNISRRCDDLEPTAYITKEWWLTGFPFYVDERVLIPRSYIAELIEKNFDGLLPDPAHIRSIQSDLFENLQNTKYDLIISNPPYVTESSMEGLPQEYRYEPSLALVAGADGMDIIDRLLKEVKAHLNDNGVLIVELGDGAENFKERFPNIEVTWLPTSGGKGGLLSAFNPAFLRSEPMNNVKRC